MWDTEENVFVTRDDIAHRIAQSYGKTLKIGTIPTNPNIIRTAIEPHAQFAILSHRWEDEELLYADMRSLSGLAMKKKGYAKFTSFVEAAKVYGCRYVWVDTFCINKDSSAELDESIRSMYNWYKSSHVCIVYLAGDQDSYPPDGNDLRSWNDEWFNRGWTLQELLAPKRLKFFWKDWSRVDDTPYDLIRDPDEQVQSPSKFKASVIERGAGMSNYDLLNYKPSPENAHLVFQWITQRRTTRPEDLAYCMIGLLDLQLPIAYGEGEERAFYRLQMECVQNTDNRSIFKWGSTLQASRWNCMLYESPRGIIDDSGEIDALPLFTPHRNKQLNLDPSFTFTNSGLRIMMTMHKVQQVRSSHDLSFDCYIFEIRDFEILLHRPPPAGEVKNWRLGILGVFSKTNANKPLAFLFREDSTKTPSRYSKVPGVEILNLPPLSKLTQRAPETVFIV
ncbi:hypothetical protein ONZ45_g19390 [Pleurotus djamor]|nr:hypothetical protein ONZ45_g19390 [Pleurotus djamor]